MKKLVFAAVFLFSSLSLAQSKCADVFLTDEPRLEIIDFDNKLEFLREEQRASAVGRVSSRVSNKFETKFFFNQVGLPDANGVLPLTSKDAKAVFVFFHGSGTQKSSGSNFTKLMNDLAQMNISAVSFDLPFHGVGPRRAEFNDATYFMNWIRQIIQSVKVEGKPIYLVGHSFGPDVVAETMARFPRLVNGGLMLSPAAFDPVLKAWYDEYTVRMDFGEPVPENAAGGEWAATVSDKFIWSNSNGKADPSKIVPTLKIRVVTGDHEEYVPAEVEGDPLVVVSPNTYDIGIAIKKHLGEAETLYLKDIGHYIFEATDSAKNNIILREILRMLKEDFKSVNEFRISKELTRAQDLAFKFSTDVLFRSWAVKNYGYAQVTAIYKKGIESQAKAMLDQYTVALEKMRMEIIRDIVSYADANPAFYLANQKAVENLRVAKKPDTGLNPIYLKELEQP